MKKFLWALCTLLGSVEAKQFLNDQSTAPPQQNSQSSVPFFTGKGSSLSTAIQTKGFERMPTVGDSKYIFDFKGVNDLPKNVTATFEGTVITPQGTFTAILYSKGVLALANNKTEISGGTLTINVPDPAGLQTQEYKFQLKGKYILESDPQGIGTRMTCTGKVCKLSIDLAKDLPGYKNIGKVNLTVIKK